MRKLLNTLFVLTESTYLSLENSNIVLNLEDKKKKYIPLLGIEEIFCFTYAGASPALIGECAERCIGFNMFSPTGKFLARATGRSYGNVLLRKEQYRWSDDEASRCKVARLMIAAKIYNSKWQIERTIRDHGLRVDVEALKEASEKLGEYVRQCPQIEDIDELRGIEGNAASIYFGIFDQMILQQKDTFTFSGRNRRPPLDPVNAMLSFGYRLLESDCAAALEGVGLDSYVGFMHTDRSGRESLALDLMEEFRAIMVDRLVLSMINLKKISSKDFDFFENGTVYLNDDGRKLFIQEWQSRKREEIKHPYLKEKIQWGLIPYSQALLLARFIRGDLDDYPAFFWK